MAKSDNNLQAVFRDTANAIREKKSSSNEISPRDFADEISTIETGITPTGSISITENANNIDVTQYASANVNVPGYPEPSGTKDITSNGNNINVKDYAAVNVNVPNPSTGTYYITENGVYNVKNYASASVSVSGGASASSNIPAWVPEITGTTYGLEITFDGVEARHDANGDIYFCQAENPSYVVDIVSMCNDGFQLPFAFNPDDQYTSIESIGDLVVNVTQNDAGPGGRASESALREYFGDYTYNSMFGVYHTLRNMYGQSMGDVMLSVMESC